MHLVLFDIDGTLLDSNLLEADCFIDAMRSVFNVQHVERDWNYYQHVTDRGIARQLVTEHRLTPPEDAELIALEKNFLTRLKQHLVLQTLSPMPGAETLLAHLLNDKRFALGLATGSFKTSAELKLKHAKLDVTQLPLASCNDHFDRINILQKAIRKAEKHYHTNQFRTITYVGDGLWDYRAANALGLNFIGVHNTSLGCSLSEHNIAQLMTHLGDIEQFMSFLAQPSII